MNPAVAEGVAADIMHEVRYLRDYSPCWGGCAAPFDSGAYQDAGLSLMMKHGWARRVTDGFAITDAGVAAVAEWEATLPKPQPKLAPRPFKSRTQAKLACPHCGACMNLLAE